MSKRKLIVAIAGIAIVGIAGSVYATSGYGSECAAKKERKVRAQVERVLDKLDATQLQRDHIAAEVDNAVAAIWELRDDQREMREAILSEWSKDTPNREALHTLVDQKLEEIRAAAHELVDSGLEVHGVLTPEQRKRVSKKLQRHNKRFRHMKRMDIENERPPL
jgi:Spy/CpxP family protein refolding chaperone